MPREGRKESEMACAEIESYALPTSPINEWDDRDIVEGILSEQEGCFDVLHDRYRGRIFGFALKRLADPAEAEDVTQEVFLQIHRCLASFQGRSTLLTWMFGIAHNQVCRRFRRKSAPIVSIDDDDALELRAEDCPPDRQVEAARVLRHCVEAVETELSPAQRKVFHLKYVENRSNRSIAKHLGKSNQAVKISLFRSRKTLGQHTPNVDAVLSI
jgi:RNA polymerase sigma-70 factor (ECF subfamily)